MNMIRIGESVITEDSMPYFVGEISGNHGGSLEKAKRLIEKAKESGADAVKLQTYTPDCLTLDIKDDRFMAYADGLWSGQYLYDLYKKAMTPWEWHKELFEYAKSIGIDIFTTPFSLKAVDFIENELECNAYKISSFDLVNIPLLKAIGETKKTVILSTGMANWAELEEAVTTLRNSGCTGLGILKCVSAYPADPGEFNLSVLRDIKSRYDCIVGVSDHTLSNEVALATVVLGGKIIEKHITLDRKDKEVDSEFSMEPGEIRELVMSMEVIYKSLGEPVLRSSMSEANEKNYRRSIYVARDMKEGESLSEDNIKIIKKSGGLHPRYWEDILGVKVSKDLLKGMPLQRDYTESHF